MTESDLNHLYNICFKRNIDSDGMKTYTNLINNGYDIEQIYTILYNSKECCVQNLRRKIQQDTKKLKLSIIFHIGSENLEVINDISRCISNLMYLSTVLQIIITSYLSIECINNLLPCEIKNSKICIFPNQGMDIGPFLRALKHLDNSSDYVVKFHTKTNKEWRHKLLQDIGKNIVTTYFTLKMLIEESPGMVCSNSVLREYQGENKETISKFFKKELNIDISNYYDITKKSVANEQLDPFFYRNYHSDLKAIIPDDRIEDDSIYHWESFGKYEHCRIPNRSCILKEKKRKIDFAAGTMFIISTDILTHMKHTIDLETHVSKMEKNYMTNEKETIVHSWEYIFPFYTKCVANKIITDNKIKYEYSNIYKHFAVFIPEPPSNALCGGTRTILNFIKYLQDSKYLVDIFICFYPFKQCDISIYEKYLYNFKVLNETNKVGIYNLFDFPKYELKYKCLIATGWQTTNFVIDFNEYDVKKVHFIQDDERKFHNKDSSYIEYGISEQAFKSHNSFDLKISITKCLSYLLYKEFNISIQAILFGVNKLQYRNFKHDRKYNVCLYFSPSKPRRLPNLIYKIIKILRDKKINFISYGENLNNNLKQYAKSVGTLNINELCGLYNSADIGICLSDSNPSRIPFEMHECGMHVIEYNSIYTQWDVPFYKINDENDAFNLIEKLNHNKSKIQYTNRNITEEAKDIVNLLKRLLI